MSDIGMMSAAYFASKSDILKWINEFFSLNYTKIEQTCTGALHCQILDAIFPGKVPLQKVNWFAKNDFEYIGNFKVLQQVFSTQKINHHVFVDKLIKGKYQDNLEFCQWIKHFFETHYGGQEYDAVARRTECMDRYAATHKHVKGSKDFTMGATNNNASKKLTKKDVSVKSTISTGSKTKTEAKQTAVTDSKVSSAEISSLNQEVEKLNRKITKLRVAAEQLEGERNFFFGKLRSIEDYCQEDPENAAEVKQYILDILYKTDDEEPKEEEEEEEENVEETED